MRIWPIVLGSGLTLLLSTGHAAVVQTHPNHDRAYYEYAKVVHVDPIVRLVRVPTPRRECWNEEVIQRDHHRGYYRGNRGSYTPLVLGGVLGGVVGNRFGSGRGRDAMTVAGALLGASVGRDVSQQPRARGAYVSTERHCRVTEDYYEEEQVDGYRVKYRYRGRTYVTRMDQHPGRRVKLEVTVTPIGGTEVRVPEQHAYLEDFEDD
jgi:uncharacterized protein YcfJ